jgi:hypothetical protein
LESRARRTEHTSTGAAVMFTNKEREIIATSKTKLSITIQTPPYGQGSILTFSYNELVHDHFINDLTLTVVYFIFFIIIG